MSAFRTLLLALFLVGIGFLVGYGYQARAPKSSASRVVPTPVATPQAPQVKGLHASPDGKLLAFTGVYSNSERAGLWILDAASRRASSSLTPTGWQDFVMQWRADGRALLLEREKIPRPVAEATAGIYLAPVARNQADSAASADNFARAGAMAPLNFDLPRGEKIVTGLLTPGGELLVRTRREPKSLYLVRGGATIPVDKTAFNYGQNRPVREGNKLIFYVVRDVPNSESVALFRVENGRSKQISPGWNDVSWSYVAPSGKQIIVARLDENEVDWNWTLYGISPQAVKVIKSARVPADVISVYWSSDEKHVLGAAGERLWSIEVPSLKCAPIGPKTDWNADDATWIDNRSVAIAENGEIWRVDVASGKAAKLWRFPDQFWE